MPRNLVTSTKRKTISAHFELRSFEKLIWQLRQKLTLGEAYTSVSYSVKACGNSARALQCHEKIKLAFVG